jgi:hypothetical protein
MCSTHSIFSSIALLLSVCGAASAQMTVTSGSPLKNENNIARTSSVSVTFDRPVNPATFTPANCHLFGKISGPITASYSFSNSDRTVTLTPARVFAAGEMIMLTISHNVRGSDNVALRSAGYTSVFTTRTSRSTGNFQQIASLSNHDASGNTTRIYGTNSCDLNRDGWCDLTTVNEISQDLRVFLNRADGSALCQPMLFPPTTIPFESSPNDIADFDGDGKIDIVTSSAAEGNIAIAFGNGDGTFRSVTTIPVGDYPRGFGIFDADGDGDFDICVACADSSYIAFVRNNGNGTFAAPATFEGGVSGEYGMNGADMNNDGIMDLVVAGINSQTISVLRGNGNGTFTSVSTRPVGGQNWVVLCGDLNNDRNMDVSTANSGSANGSILLGNGDGTLQAAQIMTTGGHTVATDLADLDGDGDLDWILSSYGAGRWYIYRNNGLGAFTLQTQIIAPNNPSCTAPCDLDNDGDMDLVFTDEIADRVIIMENIGGCSADFNHDAIVDFFDYLDFVDAFSNHSSGSDFNNDSVIDFFDYLDFVDAFSLGCS